MKMDAVRAFEKGARTCSKLESELRAQGVPVIPKHLVQAHQRKDRLPALLQTLYYLLWLPRLYFVPRIIERYTGRQYSNNYLYVVVAMTVAGLACLSMPGLQLHAALLLTPAIGCILTFCLWIYAERKGPRTTWSWRQLHLSAARKDWIIEPPARFDRRIRAAEAAGAYVLVEYTLKDPFVLAVRGFDRVYIGAWNTEDDLLDAM
ncbi:MAG: hypothetical protein AAB582_00420 [Patescibacteria group bacterium]